MMHEAPGDIEVFVNGENRAVEAGTELVDFLVSLGLQPQAVLIEYNGVALLRDEWRQTRLVRGDRLELLRVVAGG